MQNIEKKAARLALFFSSFFWGLAPPIIKYSLKFISPISLLFYRCFFTSLLFLIPLILEIKKKKPSFTDWQKYILLGFLCTPLTLLLYFLGVNLASAIDVSIVSILTPIFIVIGGFFFLHEKVSKKEIFGIILAIIGTLTVTVSFPFLSKKAFGNYLGNLLIISSGLVWALFTLLSKKKSFSHLSSFITASVSFFVGFFVLLPFFFLDKGVSFSQKALPGIIFLAVFASFLAYSAYTFGLKRIEASKATVFKYLQPIFAIPLSIILLSEKLTPKIFFGSIFIVLGVYLCEKKGHFFHSLK